MGERKGSIFLTYLNPSKKSLTLKMLMLEVAAAGTIIIGVLDLWSTYVYIESMTLIILYPL